MLIVDWVVYASLCVPCVLRVYVWKGFKEANQHGVRIEGTMWEYLIVLLRLELVEGVLGTVSWEVDSKGHTCLFISKWELVRDAVLVDAYVIVDYLLITSSA